jgi:excisionase family DNA binding protein
VSELSPESIEAIARRVAELVRRGSSLQQHWKTPELADRLGLHPETLRRAVERGEVRPVRIGRDLLWPEDEVIAWLERRRVDNGRVVQLARHAG